MAKTAKTVVKADYPHFEEKRLVKVWIKKAGKSFQLSVEGIGGRFYGSLDRKMDGTTVGNVIEPIVTKRTGHDLKASLKGMNKKALAQAILELLA